MKTVNTIRRALQDIQTLQDDNEKSENIIIQQVFKDVNTVFNVLIEILGYMEERCGISSDLDETIEKINIDYQKAGILIPLACGHSGTLFSSEKQFFAKILIEAVFDKKKEKFF